MKKNKKIISIIVVFYLIFLFGVSSCAHSGRTDSKGGHKDKNNVSGLGSYHYHCGGHEAHLHPNGECPYSTSQSSSSSTSSSANSKTSNAQTTQKSSEKNKSVEEILKKVEKIKINEDVQIMEIGENITLTTTVEPEDGYDNEIIWSSSDMEIANVDATGKVVAKKAGVVEIKAKNINGIEDSIKIVVNKEEVEENIINTDENTIEVVSIEKDANKNETTTDSISDTFSGMITMGMIAGGYIIYKNKKG